MVDRSLPIYLRNGSGMKIYVVYIYYWYRTHMKRKVRVIVITSLPTSGHLWHIVFLSPVHFFAGYCPFVHAKHGQQIKNVLW